MARTGLAEFMLAEASGLDRDAADTGGACGFDVPHAVADRESTTGIDGEPFHGGHKDVGIRLGALDVIGGGLTIDGVVGIECFT